MQDDPADTRRVLALGLSASLNAPIAMGYIESALAQQFHYPYAAEERRKASPELVALNQPFGVQAESGMMGGSESIDYLAPSGSGHGVLSCSLLLEMGRMLPPSRLQASTQAGVSPQQAPSILAELLPVVIEHGTAPDVTELFRRLDSVGDQAVWGRQASFGFEELAYLKDSAGQAAQVGGVPADADGSAALADALHHVGAHPLFHADET